MSAGKLLIAVNSSRFAEEIILAGQTSHNPARCVTRRGDYRGDGQCYVHWPNLSFGTLGLPECYQTHSAFFVDTFGFIVRIEF